MISDSRGRESVLQLMQDLPRNDGDTGFAPPFAKLRVVPLLLDHVSLPWS